MTTRVESDRYLVRYEARPEARVRLYCVPYAGAGPRCYQGWQRALPNWVEVVGVCLAGRERRLLESPLADMDSVLRDCGPIVADDIDRPFVLLGHSVGGLIAFELSLYLLDRGLAPKHLVISGCRPPQSRGGVKRDFHTLDTPSLMRELQNYVGLPVSFAGNERVLAMFARVIRADLSIDANYIYRGRSPIPCGITALGGVDDPEAPMTAIEGWRSQTTGPCEIFLAQGDHFFIESQRDAVLDKLSSILRALP